MGERFLLGRSTGMALNSEKTKPPACPAITQSPTRPAQWALRSAPGLAL